MLGGSNRYRAGLVAGAVALVAVVSATMAYADPPPPSTASYVVSGPASVTVKQGQSTTFNLQMSGTGTLPCDVDYHAWAAVDSTFEALTSFSGAGFIAQSDLSYVDFVAGADAGGVCNTSWDGAPVPVDIGASFSATCDATPDTYRTRLGGTVSGPPMSSGSLPVIDFIVVGANCPPVARDNSYSTAAGTALVVNAPGVLGNDSDGDHDSMSAVLVSGPSHASSFTLNADGSFSYTPSGSFTGADSFAYKARDGTDSSNEATVTIRVTDPTPPTVGYTLDPAAPGEGGWYSTSVDLTWQASDPDSQVTKTGCDDTTVSSDQAITPYSCTASSAGGTTGPVTVSIGYDATPPTTTLTLSPSSPNGSSGWYKGSKPTFTLSGVDARSRVSATKYQMDGGAVTTYSGSAVEIPEGQHTISYWSVDNAGNTETTHTTGTIKVDTVAPTITCTVASPGPTFLLGALNQQVSATLTEAGSGPASQSLSTAANTSSVGSKTVSFNGSDTAGNAATTTQCPYLVGYRFDGFISPLPKTTINSGSSLPVKFQLKNAAGQPIGDSEAQSLVAPTCKIAIILVKPAGAVSGCPTYSTSVKQFQFNLKTTNAMKGDNGVSITVTIGGAVVTRSPVEPFKVK